MLTMHPRVIRDALVLLGTIVFDASNSTRVHQALTLIKAQDLRGDRDYQFLPNVTVQTPCPLTLFNGAHVQHHTFTSNYLGAYSTQFYRWPGLVSTFDVIRWLDANGIPRHPTRCYHSYDCCANWYCDGVYVEHHKGHTIARIGWAMNV